MKNIFFVLMLAISFNCFSQLTTPPQPSIPEDHLLKSQKQKKTGWGLTGGGAALMIVGAAMLSSNILVDDPNSQKVKNRETTGLILLGTGGATVAVGIFHFAASKRNRKKAASLELQQQNSWVPGNKIIYKVSYPALTVKIVM